MAEAKNQEIIPPEPPRFPEHEQKIGKTTVAWWWGKPGEAVIMARGGSCDDRAFAEQIVKWQLAPFGVKRARFTFDHRSRTSSWDEITAKAKRLIQSGNVTVLRNGYNNIVGHVVGDHGEYNTEIGRDDPTSRTITTWQCECPWDQYAWQRTRQWKKYEGRPCSHVMALYWQALGTPLDEQLGPDQADSLGTGQALPPQAPPTPAPAPGAPSPFAQMPGGPPPDASLMPPSGPPQAPLAPPSPSGALPPSPMDQLQMMQPPIPGTTPAGMPAPPNSVSVPGARPPSPFGPVQFPGGTYSKTAAEFTNGQAVVAKNELYGIKEGREGATDAGDYTEVPQGTKGEVMYQDETTGWVEAIFPLDGGPMTSYHVRCFCEPSDLQLSDGNAFIKRRT